MAKTLDKNQRSHYHILKKAWTKRHRQLQKQLWSNHKDQLNLAHEAIKSSQKHIVAGSLAGLIFLSQPLASSILAQGYFGQPASTTVDETERKLAFQEDLKKVLPEDIIPLSDDQNKKVSEMLSTAFGMNVAQQLQGIQLNRTYGYIGAEQHLMRYPGDSISTHFPSNDEALQFARSGMAPGRGAWGYFSSSKDAMTQQDVEREKYYIAVQTFLSPGWDENVRKYYEFFKYRKMLVVNPENGKAMVVVIGDAGPAKSTGKHLGGSPEVMKYLERVDGAGKGPVLYYFIDDPQDIVPLGPVTMK